MKPSDSVVEGDTPGDRLSTLQGRAETLRAKASEWRQRDEEEHDPKLVDVADAAEESKVFGDRNVVVSAIAEVCIHTSVARLSNSCRCSRYDIVMHESAAQPAQKCLKYGVSCFC